MDVASAWRNEQTGTEHSLAPSSLRETSCGPLLLSLPNHVGTIFRRIRLLLGSRANPAGFFFQGIRPLIGFAANGVRLVLGGIRTCFDRLVQTVSGTILGFPRPLRRPFLDRILARYDTYVGVGLLAGILAGPSQAPTNAISASPTSWRRSPRLMTAVPRSASNCPDGGWCSTAARSADGVLRPSR